MKPKATEIKDAIMVIVGRSTRPQSCWVVKQKLQKSFGIDITFDLSYRFLCELAADGRLEKGKRKTLDGYDFVFTMAGES